MSETFEKVTPDEIQYCILTDESCYMFIEGIFAEEEGALHFDYEDTYVVYSGYVDLKACSQEQINEAVMASYASLEDMRKELSPIDDAAFERQIAACVFENQLDDNEYHGYFTRSDAMDYISNWLEDREMDEEMELY